jgi:hypothetical protein
MHDGRPGIDRDEWSESDVTNDKLVVVGQGYVGLPLAMRAVEVGFDGAGRSQRTSTPLSAVE